jgi:hypothetical protein
MAEPSPQEAYYFICSQRLAPAYFDGPGGTAFVTELASVYAKSDVIWRLVAPIWGLLATWAGFALVRRLSDSNRAARFFPIFLDSTALLVGPPP